MKKSPPTPGPNHTVRPVNATRQPSRPKPAARSQAPRPNAERTESTQAALIAAARALFVQKGYADTSTPEIAAAAQLTRGALYHHYADKADLLYAAAAQAADEVAAQVAQAGDGAATPLQALVQGAESYFAAMAQSGRARLLVLDAPAVLSPERLRALSARAGAAELQQGLRAALSANAAPATAFAHAPGAPAEPAHLLERAQLPALAEVLSAAFDRAALAIARGEPAEPYRAAMRWLLTRVAGTEPSGASPDL